MYVGSAALKGFRNFKDAYINFCNKTLIIGANDIGKSNLIYALRILLDKSLSESDLEPTDSDFYAFEETNEILVTISFHEVNEDCVLAKMGKFVSDEGDFYLRYQAKREPTSNIKSYHFFAGKSEDMLEEIQSRFYLKVLNLKYISSNRDLFSYIKKEKKHLLQDEKSNRQTTEIAKDGKILTSVESTLSKVNRSVSQLSYIKKATRGINHELKDLSYRNMSQDIVFDVGAWDVTEFVENLNLVSQVKGKNVVLGGDGRHNQIFLALWAARNGVQAENPLEVSIYCIEEPEAHLHPHQQRKLAEYLAKTLKGQVIITTHSPQIACEFSPNSIIRLYDNTPDTLAASEGCSKIVEDAFVEFGHRLDIIPAEAFFSTVVLLVEGVSEVLFYKALAPEIGVDLDRLNISVLMVDGVGFDVYINLLVNLNIDFVIRTDNDIFKIPNKNQFRFAGAERCITFYKKYWEKYADLEKLLKNKALLKGFKTRKPPTKNLEYVKRLSLELQNVDIYLAEKDLETDLANSCIGDKFKKYYNVENTEEVIQEMQKKKAEYMYAFLRNNLGKLNNLKESEIAKPLFSCQAIAEGKNV
jgi:hypothetical protein